MKNENISKVQIPQTNIRYKPRKWLCSCGRVWWWELAGGSSSTKSPSLSSEQDTAICFLISVYVFVNLCFCEYVFLCKCVFVFVFICIYATIAHPIAVSRTLLYAF